MATLAFYLSILGAKQAHTVDIPPNARVVSITSQHAKEAEWRYTDCAMPMIPGVNPSTTLYVAFLSKANSSCATEDRGSPVSMTAVGTCSWTSCANRLASTAPYITEQQRNQNEWFLQGHQQIRYPLPLVQRASARKRIKALEEEVEGLKATLQQVEEENTKLRIREQGVMRLLQGPEHETPTS
ncbi:hypothetical protein AJ80_07093 [Polytolypa hystricis UAMH7299]|uniref:Uncharacterized protein n=1 Tax=Polytolypa hystricis (strain UAMH7299) TaxID=1447883 RepID=A0A2B7XSS1_POLH7|nr:hypothetical protein AJ80_07093 [Polytolypa hystricis UAMH7299]